ncbi:hypothetical protein Tco_1397271 [Tanacetum coccineum]
MEVLTLMLHRKVQDSESFTYHRHCSKLELVNHCFADDLFLFVHGDPNSARVIMEACDEFRNASGLTPSLPKSMAYFCNVLNHVKLSILQILPFEEGRLPVKYLGVPLISTRLIYRDCKELTDRIRSRIRDCKNKSLSAAGRLQLFRSVIGSMHVYWASVFVLPTRILLELEQLMRGFLWCQGDMRKGKAKVSWEVVCLPKNEGGLGLRRLELFNKALMVTHIWNLLLKKESLWVKWIHEYKLRGRHFFEVPYSGNMTWGWRKFLQLRLLIRDHVIYHLGDGATCSLWFDRWSPCGPLADIISSRDIHRAGFNLSSKVWDSLKELAGLSNVADSITVIKCLSDEPLAIPLDEIHIDDELNFIEEPVEIMDREVKRLKQSRILIVKVRWNSRRGPKYTWEREDQMQKKYPHLFANPESASQATS